LKIAKVFYFDFVHWMNKMTQKLQLTIFFNFEDDFLHFLENSNKKFNCFAPVIKKNKFYLLLKRASK
jgi:hypothetical protein